MSDFERELREGLRRVDAPAGFAERVLARAESSVVLADRRAGRSAWWRAAAVLVVVFGLGAWLVQGERRERAEAREAQKQFRVAMRVTARVTERSFTEAGRGINRMGDKGATR